VTTRLVRDESSLKSRPDYWKCQLVRDFEKTALVKAMTVFVEVLLLDVEERNLMAFMLDVHTKFRTLRETNLRANEPCIKKCYIKRAMSYLHMKTQSCIN